MVVRAEFPTETLQVEGAQLDNKGPIFKKTMNLLFSKVKTERGVPFNRKSWGCGLFIKGGKTGTWGSPSNEGFNEKNKAIRII